MRFRSFLLGSVAALSLTSSALAQTTTKVKVTAPYIGGAVTAAGYYPAGTPNFYVSPYAGVLNFGTADAEKVVLNCVDYFHGVSVGDVWEVKVTNLGEVAAGNQTLAATRAAAAANALTLYKQAAWLTMQYDMPNPAVDPNQTRAIQSAIWNLFNTAAPDPTYAGSVNEWRSSWWMQQSVAGAASLSTEDLKYFSVLSDTHMNPYKSDRQEFLIHTTPEPATLALLATGFAGLAAARRKRRGKGDADSGELAQP